MKKNCFCKEVEVINCPWYYILNIYCTICMYISIEYFISAHHTEIWCEEEAIIFFPNSPSANIIWHFIKWLWQLQIVTLEVAFSISFTWARRRSWNSRYKSKRYISKYARLAPQTTAWYWKLYIFWHVMTDMEYGTKTIFYVTCVLNILISCCVELWKFCVWPIQPMLPGERLVVKATQCHYIVPWWLFSHPFRLPLNWKRASLPGKCREIHWPHNKDLLLKIQIIWTFEWQLNVVFIFPF